MGDIKQNIAHFIIVIMTSKRLYLHQMKLHNSGLCDYCGKTEAVGHYALTPPSPTFASGGG